MTKPIENIAVQLADETLKRAEETGNERPYYMVAKIVGTSSPTLQKSLPTEVLIRLAAKKGLICEKIETLVIPLVSKDDLT